MLPSFFEVLESLPLTTNGKVDRKALPAPSMGSRELRQYGPLPRNPLEETVAEIWQQVLGLENLGVRADFEARRADTREDRDHRSRALIGRRARRGEMV